jgi:hypothetical protein
LDRIVPIFRALSGGIETVIEAYDTASARSPLNISPASAVDGFRVVAASSGTRAVPSADVALAMRTPRVGRPLQSQHKNATAVMAAMRNWF